MDSPIISVTVPRTTAVCLGCAEPKQTGEVLAVLEAVALECQSPCVLVTVLIAVTKYGPEAASRLILAHDIIVQPFHHGGEVPDVGSRSLLTSGCIWPVLQRSTSCSQAPPPKSFTTSPNSTTSWGPAVPIHEPVRIISHSNSNTLGTGLPHPVN